jgi:hypothetical protein
MMQKAKINMITEISRIFGGAHAQPSEKKAERVQNTSETEEFERCVMCGELTGIPVATPVEFRECYEIGCGQLCVDCCKKMGKVTERQDARLRKEIMAAAEQCPQDRGENS